MSSSLPPDYFEKLYETSPDPWNFTGSEYEAEKYARTVATLDRSHYGSALEIGCSIGIFTRMLAQKCDRLLAVDVSERALAQARQRNADLGNVSFELRSAPQGLPDGCFDLTVVSEIGYYLTMSDLELLGDYIQSHSERNGQLLLVHWLPFEPDHRVTGDEVHEFFLNFPNWQCLASYRGEKYRIELLQKTE